MTEQLDLEKLSKEATEKFTRLFDMRVDIKKSRLMVTDGINPRYSSSGGFIFVSHTDSFNCLVSSHDVFKHASGSKTYDIFRALFPNLIPDKVQDEFRMASLRYKYYPEDDHGIGQMLSDMNKFIEYACYVFPVYYCKKEDGEQVLSLQKYEEGDKRDVRVGSLVCTVSSAIKITKLTDYRIGDREGMQKSVEEAAAHQISRYNDYINSRAVDIHITSNVAAKRLDANTYESECVLYSDINTSLGAIKHEAIELEYRPFPFAEPVKSLNQYISSCIELHRLMTPDNRNSLAYVAKIYVTMLNEKLCDHYNLNTRKVCYEPLFSYAGLSGGLHVKYSDAFFEAIENGDLKVDRINNIATSEDFVEAVRFRCKDELVKRSY